MFALLEKRVVVKVSLVWSSADVLVETVWRFFSK
jgi:hypothetical protein